MKIDKRLVIEDNTMIYVAAPAMFATGGPEALHQITHHLRINFGYKAYMYYWPSHVEDPIHPEYQKYGNPYVKEIIDDPVNILIVPEIAEAISLLIPFTKIRKVIWWLSVDNFLITSCNLCIKQPLNRRFIKIIRRFPLAKKIADRFFPCLEEKLILRTFLDLGVKQVALHLCHSFYAAELLKRFSFHNVAYLSDYPNKDFLAQDMNIKKKDIVAFNPAKGIDFTNKIRMAAFDINFVPIQNMRRIQVIELLKEAKIYIDFGHHPGKDRIPREAAILGCCIIVGKRGSATNEYDVPIPNKYKFEVSEKAIPKIVEIINFCLAHYKEAYSDFDGYRESVRGEHKRFLKDLKAIFVHAHQKMGAYSYPFEC